MTSQELFSCDFPVYTVHCLSECEFYVAGGGGEARTGVPNALVRNDQCSLSLFRTTILAWPGSLVSP